MWRKLKQLLGEKEWARRQPLGRLREHLPSLSLIGLRKLRASGILNIVMTFEEEDVPVEVKHGVPGGGGGGVVVASILALVPRGRLAQCPPARPLVISNLLGKSSSSTRIEQVRCS